MRAKLRWRVLAGIFFGAFATLVMAAGEKPLPEGLGGPDRYLTFVSADKPIYRCGETAYFRGVLLGAINRLPLKPGESARPRIEIKGPKGDTVVSGMAVAQDSVWGFAWAIPDGQPGGEYTLAAAYPWDGHAPAQRKFDIRAYRAPRLKSQIVFLRDGYGPGEKVVARLHTERAEGGIPDGAKVSATARVDGVEIEAGAATVDEAGNCSVAFTLPREIPHGEGALALAIQDGGVLETATKTIPIILHAVDVKLYAEGGDLVAGLPGRVYFEAKQPNGKPADIQGEVWETPPVNARAPMRNAGRFFTDHEGRGRFDLTPRAGFTYALKITEPAGVTAQVPLPQAKPQGAGAVIRALDEITPAGQPVRLRVDYREGATFKVTLAKREVEVAAATVDLTRVAQREPAAGSTVVLNPGEFSGVLRATVFDAQGVPLAERLVYREPANKLNVRVTADKNSFIPGEPVTLTIKATDAAGKPVAAVVGVTVTDDSVLEMIERREQAPRLPVMALLEPEVRELADASVYLDSKDPRAPLAVDLLLGTQGWRRFAFVDPAKFIEEYGDSARRVLAFRMPVMRFRGNAHGGGQWGADREAVILDGVQARMAAPPAARPMEVKGLEKVKEDQKAEAEKLADKKFLADKPRASLAAAAEPMAGPMAKVRMQRLEAAGKQMAEGPLVVVREYAHAAQPGRKPEDRVDFAETLYWTAGVKTDPLTGTATARFALSDSVTTFRVRADGFAGDGALGAGNAAVESVQPFYVEPKLPLEVTAGDVILLPVALVNSTSGDLPGGAISAQPVPGLTIADVPPLNGLSTDRVRRLMQVVVGDKTGGVDFILNASAGPYTDRVVRKLNVKPAGFPIQIAYGGMVGPEAPVAHDLVIPAGVVPGSLEADVSVYPSPLANLTDALQGLIRDPNGCFEQTSSTSYPLTMAQQYFLTHTGVEPRLVEQSRQKLDAGYKRLVGFWCPDKGYEWFGQDPGHEALTAFGLLHFNDMAQVREVDGAMVSQTRAWLLKQRDGKGGFARKRRALHTWIEDKDCSNAYILWALLESGEPAKNLETEIAALKTAAAESKNSYVTALAANVFALSGDKAEAKRLMDALSQKQAPGGEVAGGTATIVGSGGQALVIETTALAALAWLREPAFAGCVEKSMRFLADSCKAGRYGSTQSTVLALRAIIGYDKSRARPKTPGKLRLYVDDKAVGEPVAFGADTQGVIHMPSPADRLAAGNHRITVRMEDGAAMPYSIAVRCNAATPASSEQCKLNLAVRLAKATVAEGATTEILVRVTNKTADALPMTVAIVGLPGGLEPRHDQLKELVKKGVIDAYEVIGREVVLYWRSFAANAVVETPLSLVAAVPGTYTGPASRTYLYYTDEFKQWTDGMQVKIEPR